MELRIRFLSRLLAFCGSSIMVAAIAPPPRMATLGSLATDDVVIIPGSWCGTYLKGGTSCGDLSVYYYSDG